MPAWFAANLDYLIYVLACLVVFGALDVWLRRRAPPGRLPKWAWLAAAVLYVLLLAAIFR